MVGLIEPVGPNERSAAAHKLHAALQALGFEVDPAESREQLAGASTARLVAAFQTEAGLAGTPGVLVDDLLAAALNRLLKEKGLLSTASGTYRVTGRVTRPYQPTSRDKIEAIPLPGVTVEVFARALANDDLLGKTATNSSGQYEIAFVADQVPDQGPKNLYLQVSNAEGRNLARSQILSKSSLSATVDISVRNPMPGYSEFERTEAEISRVPNGRSIGDLKPEDLQSFSRQAGVPLDMLSAAIAADQSAKTTDLPVAACYALARQGVPLEPDALAAIAPADIRTKLAGALQLGILPRRLEAELDSLVAQFTSFRQRRFAWGPWQGFVTLSSIATGHRLQGYSVDAYDLDVAASLGTQILGSDGRLNVKLGRVSNGPPASDAKRTRRIRLSVTAPVGYLPVAAKLELPVQEGVEAQAKLDLPDQPTPELHDISRFATEFHLSIPPGVRSQMDAAGVHTLEDIRTKGGLTRLAGDDRHPVTKLLDAHAGLAVLSPDVRLNALLISRGYTSVPAIARATRASFVTAMHDDIGDFSSAELHARAAAQTMHVGGLVAGMVAGTANGYAAGLIVPTHPLPVATRCDCEDCEAAVSPAAYLADLLDYAIQHVKRLVGVGRDAKLESLTLPDLVQMLCQPFDRLPSECEAVSELVHQVRICIEVLRCYLVAHPPTLAQDRALLLAQRTYLLDAYTSLLANLGTSFEEVRLAFIDDATDLKQQEQQQADLADRLGIPHEHLQKLLLCGTVLRLISAHPQPILPKHQFPIAQAALGKLLKGIGLQSGLSLATAPHPLRMVHQRTEAALEALFGLRVEDTTTPDVSGTPLIPQVETWRKQYLRSVWMQEDLPSDIFSEQPTGQLRDQDMVPVIDPDVVGPDDIRITLDASSNPDLAGQPVYQVWQTRRRQVDEWLANLKAMREANDEPAKSAFPALLASVFGAKLPDPDTMLLQLTGQGSAAEQAATQAQVAAEQAAAQAQVETLGMTRDGFIRLMELRARDQVVHKPPPGNAVAPAQDPALADSEWGEVYDILARVQKVAAYQTWRSEESQLSTTLKAVLFGPASFWPCLKEPDEGAWPPSLTAGQPLIDPELVKLDDLPEPTAGRAARKLRQDRNAALGDLRAQLGRAFATQGFGAAAGLAFGGPTPDLAGLATDLASPTASTVAEATKKAADLHLTVDGCRTLARIGIEAAPASVDVAQAVALLATVWKQRALYPTWLIEEEQNGLGPDQYWLALKSKLPHWRCPSETRAAWRQGLFDRSQPALIDPDLIDSKHFPNPSFDDSAYKLWSSRWHAWTDNEQIGSRWSKLVESREQTDEPLDWIVASVQMMVGAPVVELQALDAEDAQGSNIDGRLAQLSLPRDAFQHLLRVRDLAAGHAEVLPSEWDDAASILLQVAKMRATAQWRFEERAGGVVLCSDHFQMPVPPPLQFPPPAPRQLPAWRASARALQDWEDTLQARIGQDETVAAGLRAAVYAVEEVTLPPLRDALVMATSAMGSTLGTKAGWLTDRLLIDAKNGGQQKTTRAAQAIESIQVLLWSLRTGQLAEAYPNLVLDADRFDDEWKWIGSYATWRAAMFVFLYPENILTPNLRSVHEQTPVFSNILADLRQVQQLTPDQAQSYADRYISYLKDVSSLTAEASCEAITRIPADAGKPPEYHRLFYTFGRGGKSGSVYWSEDDRDTTSGSSLDQSFWASVPGLETGVLTLIGAVPFEMSPDRRVICLFAQMQAKSAQTLVFVRYDLEAQSWNGEPVELELPGPSDAQPGQDGLSPVTMFTAVVEQHARTSLLRGGTVSKKPRLAVRLPDGSINLRAVNEDATGWDGSDWVQLVGKDEGTTYPNLQALVEVDEVSLWLFASDRSDTIVYKIFDESGNLEQPKAPEVAAAADATFKIDRDPVACASATGAVDLFVPGGPAQSRAVWHLRLKSESSEWSSLGAPLGFIDGRITATIRPSGTTDIIAQTSYFPADFTSCTFAHALLTPDGVAESWEYLPPLEGVSPYIISDVSACSWSESRFDVIAIDYQKNVWHCWHDTLLGWSGWNSTGTPPPANAHYLSSTSRDFGHIDLFCYSVPPGGIEWVLNQTWFDLGSGWHQQWEAVPGLGDFGGNPGPDTGPLATISSSPGQIEVFYKQQLLGTNRSGVFRVRWTSTSGWGDGSHPGLVENGQLLGGGISFGPAVVSAGGIQVLAVSIDGQILRSSEQGEGWSKWASLGPITINPAPSSAASAGWITLGTGSWIGALVQQNFTVIAWVNNGGSQFSIVSGVSHSPTQPWPLLDAHDISTHVSVTDMGDDIIPIAFTKKEVFAGQAVYRAELQWTGADLKVRPPGPVQSTPIMDNVPSIVPGSADVSNQSLISLELTRNAQDQLSNLLYFEEAYYFVPISIALQLQSLGQYVEALDWFRAVFDYTADVVQQKVIGLAPDVATGGGYVRGSDWLLDPLNPHAIARARPNTYWRFTVLAIVRCVLEYADAEYTADNAESVPRARVLYTTALRLLRALTPLILGPGCNELIISLGDDIDVAPPLSGLLGAVKAGLAQIGDRNKLEQTVRAVSDLLRSPVSERPEGEGTVRGASSEATLTAALQRVRAAAAHGASAPVIGEVAAGRADRQDAAFAIFLTIPEVVCSLTGIGDATGQAYRHHVEVATGISEKDILSSRTTFPVLRRPMLPLSQGTADPVMSAANPVGILTGRDPLGLGKLVRGDEPSIIGMVMQPPGLQYVPDYDYHFCVPPNPLLKALRSRAELNLYKIRTSRDIAGIRRDLDPYVAPTDTESGLPTIGTGGQLVLPGTSTLQPTPYRYATLIDRAKQLVQLATQIESSMLSAIEKADAEAYSLLKARQDISMANAQVRLQDLRVIQAGDGVSLAMLQLQRAQVQIQDYQAAIDAGLTKSEQGMIDAYQRAADGRADAVRYGAWAQIEQASLGVNPTNVAGMLGLAAFSAATILQGSASISAARADEDAQVASVNASFERRKQEWEMQRDVAAQDFRIAAQQITTAQDQVRVTGQERDIAALQAEHATAVVDFLSTKFTNVELYDWMSDVLQRVYSFFLQQATSMARLAANQLAFERQEAPPVIQADYWSAPSDGTQVSDGSNGQGPDRRGLTGSARLLQDIYQLDQYAFDTNKRKLQLSKTISLTQLDPFAFARLRETGIMTFATPMAIFDRDFPGHYLRLIRRVQTSVIALIPPPQGIRATLSTTGPSRVVVGGDTYQAVPVRRDPETVALSGSPINATGLFELDPQPEMLLPFEGLGVDAQWEFRMPKASNPFDFDTLADVLITIEYTALNSFDYRDQLIQRLDPSVSGDLAYSFRTQLADQWYDLHNPDQATLPPMTVDFPTGLADFPPNLTDLRIQQVALYFVRTAVVGASDTVEPEVQVTGLRFTEAGATVSVGGAAVTVDGVVSTRKGNAGAWLPMIGKSPAGDWTLSLPDTYDMRKRFTDDRIEDILLVVTYSGRAPDWPG